MLEALLHKGPLTHRELGRKVLTSAGNMTDVVDKLEARGLVARVRDTADRRQVRVELTDAGRTMIERVFPPHAADITSAMSGELDTAAAANAGRPATQAGHGSRAIGRGAGPCFGESDNLVLRRTVHHRMMWRVK